MPGKEYLLYTKERILETPLEAWFDNFTFAAITDFIEYLYSNPLEGESKEDALDILGFILLHEIDEQTMRESVNAEALQQYEKLRLLTAKLFYVVFPYLTPEGMDACIENYLEEMLQVKDLRYNTLEYLKYNNDEESGWKLRTNIIELLHQSEVLIGDTRLNLGKGMEESRPTIHNWLLDYDTNIENEKHSTLDLLNYLNNNKNVSNLSQEYITRLQKLLSWYDFLRFYDGEEIENPEVEIMIKKNEEYQTFVKNLANSRILNAQTISVSNEVEEELNPEPQSLEQKTELEIPSEIELKKTKATFTPEEILAPFSAFMDMNEEVFELEKQIFQKTGGDVSLLTPLLDEYIQNKDFLGSFAVLRIAASNRELARLALVNQYFGPAYWENLQKIYGKEYANLEAAKLSGEEAYVSIFLQWLLLVKLERSIQETVYVGLDLSNILIKIGAQEYTQMVYADLKKGEFRWTPIIAEAGKLQFKK